MSIAIEMVRIYFSLFKSKIEAIQYKNYYVPKSEIFFFSDCKVVRRRNEDQNSRSVRNTFVGTGSKSVLLQKGTQEWFIDDDDCLLLSQIITDYLL